MKQDSPLHVGVWQMDCEDIAVCEDMDVLRVYTLKEVVLVFRGTLRHIPKVTLTFCSFSMLTTILSVTSPFQQEYIEWILDPFAVFLF